MPNGKYRAVVTLGYYLDGDKLKRKTRSKVFEKKKDAIAYLPELRVSKVPDTDVTFKELYEKWFPTHRAGKSTLDCYKSAIKYFSPVYSEKIVNISVDDLQECIDSCPHGKRTKENMRAVAGLMYKFGIPRNLIPSKLNLAQYLLVDGDGASHRESFTVNQIEAIKNACGKVPHAEDVLIMIYTGFRPSEYLALTADSYDNARNCLIGGSKTQAGKGRAVTISPKIKPLVERSVASGHYLCSDDGKQMTLKAFTENYFYPLLDAVGIENPIVEVGGGKTRHKYTPHTCRHTFATLMKRVEGSDKDKQALIGHASSEMLRYYQDEQLEDLRKITDRI